MMKKGKEGEGLGGRFGVSFSSNGNNNRSDSNQTPSTVVHNNSSYRSMPNDPVMDKLRFRALFCA